MASAVKGLRSGESGEFGLLFSTCTLGISFYADSTAEGSGAEGVLWSEGSEGSEGLDVRKRADHPRCAHNRSR